MGGRYLGKLRELEGEAGSIEGTLNNRPLHPKPLALSPKP